MSVWQTIVGGLLFAAVTYALLWVLTILAWAVGAA